jgi:hypothetical protein
VLAASGPSSHGGPVTATGPRLHLRRRHRPRPGQRQQPQPERRPVARSDRRGGAIVVTSRRFATPPARRITTRGLALRWADWPVASSAAHTGHQGHQDPPTWQRRRPN